MVPGIVLINRVVERGQATNRRRRIQNLPGGKGFELNHEQKNLSEGFFELRLTVGRLIRHTQAYPKPFPVGRALN
jgi:hypothetical protein